MSAHSEEEDKTIYKVVRNHEEQYSIWPEYKENPLGWEDAGKSGPKAECLAYIKEVWTDMRPLSLRQKMEELANNPPAPSPATPAEPQESLVDRLSAGDHAVEVSLRPSVSAKAFKEALDTGYVRIKFAETKGGTELGVRVNKDLSDFQSANFDQATGRAKVVGDLTLDYTKVRCVADIDLQTLAGQGHLEKIAAAEA
ncbi:MAG TPA: MbtH family NRPS accessory protein [Pyrinomonadaceae bacterium]|nr:MbtH family NRPS accessory protein [Pyrinomonadaceae bacterium]